MPHLKLSRIQGVLAGQSRISSRKWALHLLERQDQARSLSMLSTSPSLSLTARATSRWAMALVRKRQNMNMTRNIPTETTRRIIAIVAHTMLIARHLTSDLCRVNTRTCPLKSLHPRHIKTDLGEQLPVPREPARPNGRLGFIVRLVCHLPALNIAIPVRVCQTELLAQNLMLLHLCQAAMLPYMSMVHLRRISVCVRRKIRITLPVELMMLKL